MEKRYSWFNPQLEVRNAGGIIREYLQKEKSVPVKGWLFLEENLSLQLMK